MVEWGHSAFGCGGPHPHVRSRSPRRAAWMIWVTSPSIWTGGSCSFLPARCPLRAPAVREDQAGEQQFACSGCQWWGWSKTKALLPKVIFWQRCLFLLFFPVITDAKAVVAIVSVSPPHLVFNHSWSCILYWFHGPSHLPWRPYGTHSRLQSQVLTLHHSASCKDRCMAQYIN